MRLLRPNESPVGGFVFETPDGNLISGQDVGLDGLTRRVEAYLRANGFEVPADLRHHIEDQICRNQPNGKCRYSGQLGDQISKAIHGVAGVIDKVLGTDLEKKARRCAGCGRRRMKLNK